MSTKNLMSGVILGVLISLGALSSYGGALSSVEEPSPEELRKLWAELSPDEQAQLKQRYREFVALSAKEREVLKLRHIALREVYDEVGQEQAEPRESNAIERRLMRDRVRRRLQGSNETLTKRFPELDGAGGDVRALMRRAADASREQLRGRLIRLTEAEKMTEQEKSRWINAYSSGSTTERVAVVRNLMLRHPSGFGLDRAKLRRIREGDLISFARFLSEFRESRGTTGIPSAFALTRSQVKQLRETPAEERGAVRGDYLRANVRRVLIDAGIPAVRVDALLEIKPDRELLNRAHRLFQRTQDAEGSRNGPKERKVRGAGRS